MSEARTRQGTMDERILSLLDIIREEIRIYRDLVEHVRRKTVLLATGRIEAVLEFAEAEAGFNSRLRALENQMVNLCQELSRALEIPCAEFSLQRLAETVEKSLAQEIRSQVVLFRNIVGQLKAVSQRNMRLLERSLGSRGPGSFPADLRALAGRA